MWVERESLVEEEKEKLEDDFTIETVPLPDTATASSSSPANTVKLLQ
jgi:hypothetical protein